MNQDSTASVSLTLPEVKAVFVQLKRREDTLDAVGRMVLIKLERALHQALCIEEMDRLTAETTR
jgi:hypothetical protein